MPGGGIIPACAGFTLVPTSPYATLSDHPRVRGVYSGRHSMPMPVGGSSPHARGLRERPLLGGQGLRIIPACAGFTGWGTGAAGCGGDHPRMRGVYGDYWVAIHSWVGSSPHARGLRYPPQLPRPERRIIPACAGFTVCGVHPRRDAADHPRMRGVYMDEEIYVLGQGGSSPHARGLPSAECTRGVTPRIIPACAGFTGRRR